MDHAHTSPLPATAPDLPAPPFVPLRGIANFRDLASVPPVRRGVVFRSADPTRATDDAIATIRALGIAAVFDLRSVPELAASPGARWPGIATVWAPVFADDAADPASLGRRFADYQDADPAGVVRAYRSILVSGAGAYARVARHLIASPDAVLIHCTAGKDRTGVLGALFLSLCGVDDEAVADEYHLTEAGLGKEWTETLVQTILRMSGPAANEEGVRRMVSSRRDGMAATLVMLREEFGGAEGYFEKTCGLTADEVARLRERLTDA